MGKRLIVLSTHQGCEKPFQHLFDSVVHLSFHNPFEVKLTKDDVLLFEGGTDVNPHLYGEEPNGAGPSDPVRDGFEQVMFIKAKKLGIPMLGICRGSQFLNVMNGGKLHQHIEGHCADHEIQTCDEDYFIATSTHHQMWKPTDKMQWLAWADTGVFEHGFEPEVGWYPETKSLLIQGHPEYLYEGHAFWNYSKTLVELYLLEGKNVQVA